MTGQLYSDASSEHHATNIRVQTMQTNKPSSSPFTPLLPNYAIGSDKWMMCRMNELNMGFVDMLRTPPVLSTHKADAPATPLLKPAEKKPPTDPRMPKRACSSFILFSNAERANVKCEHPSATPVEILKSLGEKWRAADADTKAKYAALYLEHKAKADHARRVYATEAMTSSIPVCKPKPHPTHLCVMAGSAPSNVCSKPKAKPPADPRMPKRACSSFILFSNAERANVKCEHPSATPVEILKSLGEKWRAADADTKAKYAALYLEHKAKADHARRVYATGEVASPIPSDRASQKCETPDQTTSLPDDDDSAGQWCDGYSRAVPNTPGSTDYPHILWKLRI